MDQKADPAFGKENRLIRCKAKIVTGVMLPLILAFSLNEADVSWAGESHRSLSECDKLMLLSPPNNAAQDMARYKWPSNDSPTPQIWSNTFDGKPAHFVAGSPLAVLTSNSMRGLFKEYQKHGGVEDSPFVVVNEKLLYRDLKVSRWAAALREITPMYVEFQEIGNNGHFEETLLKLSEFETNPHEVLQIEIREIGGPHLDEVIHGSGGKIDGFGSKAVGDRVSLAARDRSPNQIVIDHTHPVVEILGAESVLFPLSDNDLLILYETSKKFPEIPITMRAILPAGYYYSVTMLAGRQIRP